MDEVAEVADVVVAVDVEVPVQKAIHQRMTTTRTMRDKLSHRRWRTPQQRVPPKSSTWLST